MTLRMFVEVTVRPRNDGSAEITFIPLKGLSPLRNVRGGLVLFSIPLDRCDGGLAALVRDFAMWLSDLAAEEVQAERDAVHRAATAKPK